jgi:hypothetical protein
MYITPGAPGYAPCIIGTPIGIGIGAAPAGIPIAGPPGTKGAAVDFRAPWVLTKEGTNSDAFAFKDLAGTAPLPLGVLFVPDAAASSLVLSDLVGVVVELVLIYLGSLFC